MSLEESNEILGRERELSVITSYVRSPRTLRVLVMWGPVGSGRSFLLRHILNTERNAMRVFLDLSPTPKSLEIPGVLEMGKCAGRAGECIDAGVREGLERGEAAQRVIIAVDGVVCERSEDCKLPILIRSIARLVEAYSDRLRVIISLDDLEASLLLGSVAEYVLPLVVAGLPPEAAAELARREARRAGLELTRDQVENIVGATGGLPYQMLVIIHEYRGDVDAWLRDIAFKVRWKLTLISTVTSLSVREAAKSLLDMNGRQIVNLPRHAYNVLRAALRTNLVYVDEYGVVRFQLPAYRGILHSVAYGGSLTGQ